MPTSPEDVQTSEHTRTPSAGTVLSTTSSTGNNMSSSTSSPSTSTTTTGGTSHQHHTSRFWSFRVLVNIFALVFAAASCATLLTVNLSYGDSNRVTCLQDLLVKSAQDMQTSVAGTINTTVQKALDHVRNARNRGLPFPSSSAASSDFNAANGALFSPAALLHQHHDASVSTLFRVYTSAFNPDTVSVMTRYRDGTASMSWYIDSGSVVGLAKSEYWISSVNGGVYAGGGGLDTYAAPSDYSAVGFNLTTNAAITSPVSRMPATRTGVNGPFWNLGKALAAGNVPPVRLPVYSKLSEVSKGVAFPIPIMINALSDNLPFAYSAVFLRISDFGAVLNKFLVGGNETSRAFIVDGNSRRVVAASNVEPFVDLPWPTPTTFLADGCYGFAPAKSQGCVFNMSEAPELELMHILTQQQPELLNFTFHSNLEFTAPNITKVVDGSEREWDAAVLPLLITRRAGLTLRLFVFTPADLYSAAAIRARNVAIIIAVVLAVVITVLMFVFLTFITTVVSDLAQRMENPFDHLDRHLDSSTSTSDSNENSADSSRRSSDGYDAASAGHTPAGSSFASPTAAPQNAASPSDSAPSTTESDSSARTGSSSSNSSTASLMRKAQGLFTELVLVQAMFVFTMKRINLLRGFVNATAFKHLVRRGGGISSSGSGTTSLASSGNTGGDGGVASPDDSARSGDTLENTAASGDLADDLDGEDSSGSRSRRAGGGGEKRERKRVHFKVESVSAAGADDVENSNININNNEDGISNKNNNKRSHRHRHRVATNTTPASPMAAGGGSAVAFSGSTAAAKKMLQRGPRQATHRYAFVSISFPFVAHVAQCIESLEKPGEFGSPAGGVSADGTAAPPRSPLLSVQQQQQQQQQQKQRSNNMKKSKKQQNRISPEHALMMVTKEAAKQAHNIVERSHVTTVEFFGDELLCCFRLRPTGRSKILVSVLNEIVTASYAMEKSLSPLVKQQQEQGSSSSSSDSFNGVFVHAGLCAGNVRTLTWDTTSSVDEIHSLRAVAFFGASVGNCGIIRQCVSAAGRLVREPIDFSIATAHQFSTAAGKSPPGLEAGQKDDESKQQDDHADEEQQHSHLSDRVELPYAIAATAQLLMSCDPEYVSVVTLDGGAAMAPGGQPRIGAEDLQQQQQQQQQQQGKTTPRCRRVQQEDDDDHGNPLAAGNNNIFSENGRQTSDSGELLMGEEDDVTVFASMWLPAESAKRCDVTNIVRLAPVEME